ncbi:MAG: MaoC/PaaZ C-terminal domain-containing protein [Kiloniellales bacterium]
MSFDMTQIGRTIETAEFRVNSLRLAQFAAAIDDESPRHLEGEVATPLFANVPPMQAMLEALRCVTGDFALHGQHDFHFYRPIVPGMRLFSRARVQGLQPSPSGVSIVIRLETRDADKGLVNEQFFTAFVVGAKLEQAAGEAAPAHRLPDEVVATTPLARAIYALQPDQTRRYADAARDYSDYTLDLDAARAKGFDAILVHGMLTMAFASRAVVAEACGADSTNLKRLAGRFSKPVFLLPGQAISTTLWQLGRRDGRRLVGYQAENAAGDIVIKHGLAEITA